MIRTRCRGVDIAYTYRCSCGGGNSGQGSDELEERGFGEHVNLKRGLRSAFSEYLYDFDEWKDIKSTLAALVSSFESVELLRTW